MAGSIGAAPNRRLQFVNRVGASRLGRHHRAHEHWRIAAHQLLRQRIIVVDLQLHRALSLLVEAGDERVELPLGGIGLVRAVILEGNSLQDL